MLYDRLTGFNLRQNNKLWLENFYCVFFYLGTWRCQDIRSKQVLLEINP